MIGIINRIAVGEVILKSLGIRLPKRLLEEARLNNNYPLGLIVLPKLVSSMQSSENVVG